jgi:hypothetical protein
MLLHLPIAILATLSPIAVSDTVPRFDVVRECRFEGGSTGVIDRCTQDEAAALQATSNGVVAVREYRYEGLHGRNDDRRFQELRRAADLLGNGKLPHDRQR